jgi:hydroxypyruvate reductase
MSRFDAISIFRAACAAVLPEGSLPAFIKKTATGFLLDDKHYSRENFNRVKVLAMGKAASSMALVTHELLDDLITDGLVVTKTGHALPGIPWPIIEAGHPVPDQNSVDAGRSVTNFLSGLNEDDLLIVLTSGGASSLVSDLPANAILADLQKLFTALLLSGANIREMNTVRKHLSIMKGGQLARLVYPATVHNFVLSDVPGDDLSTIASGPFFPDNGTFSDAADVLHKYGLYEEMPAPLLHRIEAGLEGRIADTPGEGDRIFDRVYHHLVATNRIAMEAAAREAHKLGYRVLNSSSQLEGECRFTAANMVNEISQLEIDVPTCVIAGGETTVTINGQGKGGRNQEFALSALNALLQIDTVNWPVILSGGTDGSDGPTDAAGAIVDALLVEQMWRFGLDTGPFLENNDSWHFFAALDGLLITGPTQTNVMDLVIILLQKPLGENDI